MPGTGRQLHKEEIQAAVINDVVTAIIQFTIDIGQQAGDPLHWQHLFQHIDGEDAAELIKVIPLVYRRWQQLALHPILHIVGLQAGDGRYLGQHDAAA